jgi:hypothetical protein
MRRWLALTLVVVSLGVVSACGGSSSKQNAQTLPPAPALTVPGGEQAPPLDAGATGTTGATGATGTTAPASNSGGSSPATPTQPATTVGSAGGGAQAPSGNQQKSTTAPSGGAQAPSSQKGLSDFCNQNPGAC